MADLPEILSKEEIAGRILNSFLSRTQVVNDVSQGSVLSSLIEAFAEAGFRISADNITMIDASSIDRASGDALKRIANDKKVPILSAANGTGLVNIFDDSFTKISDKVYAGRPAPVAGTRFIFVSNATAFSAVGSIYIGRGTSSVEGPLSYGTDTAIDPDDGFTVVQGIVPKAGGAYYMIVLDTASTTTKFHNLGESVILAQGGDRLVGAGTTVQTKQAVASESVVFTTTNSVKILDGEVQVTSVPIISSEPGTKDNVSRGAITQVLGLPFPARAFNNLPITNATDDDTDETLRERIKRYEQAKAKGTEVAILQAALGVTAPDELKRTSSVSIVRTAGSDQAVVFDDGSGYEPIDSGVGLEQLVDEALGGEKEFQLQNTMIERASVKTLALAPFDIIGGDTLDVYIDGDGLYTHTFQDSDFRIFRQADAFEVVSSINSNSALPFIARTLAGGTQVLLTPKTAQNIQVQGGSSNTGLKFPTNTIYTIRLYRNDVPQYQEGRTASVTSNAQPNWSTIIAGSEFRYSIDNTPEVIRTLQDSDFQKYGPTYVVNKDTPLAIWAKVLNDKLSGITVTVASDKLKFTSNLGKSTSAAIYINNTNVAYIGASMFGNSDLISSTGKTSDFDLNIKTGQLQWNTVFTAGESATAGSKFTRARFETSELPTTLSLGSTFLYLWITVDGNASQIAHTVAGTSVTIDANPSGYPANTSKIEANSQAFVDVQVGDYVVFWKNSGEAFLSDGNAGIFRVYEIDHADAAFVVIDNPEASDQLTPFALPAVSRLTFVRSSQPVQVAEIDPTLITTPGTLRDTLNAQFQGTLSTTIGTVVRTESKSLDDNKSQILVAAMTDNVASLGILLGTYASVSSHAGFVESDKQNGYGMPLFKLLNNQNSSLAQTIADAGNVANIGNYYLNDGNQNDTIQYLDWNAGYFDNDAGTITSYNFKTLNKNAFEQITRYSTSSYSIEPLRKGLTYRGTYNSGTSRFNLTGGYYSPEPYTLRQNMMFDVKDTLSFVVDQDDTLKAFIAPVARKVKVSSSPAPSAFQFDLTDAESNLDFNDPSTFRDFDFSNFKFWTNAKVTVPTGPTISDSIKLKYLDFGPTGSKNGISIRFPASGGQLESHSIVDGPINDIQLITASSAEKTTGVDATSAFTVENLGISGGIEYFKYQWRVGTTPNFATVVGGDVVNISGGSSFLSVNKGIFLITDNILYPPTATSFTVERIPGTGAQELTLIALDGVDYPTNISPVPFSSGGQITVTTATPHNLNTGDVVGLYGLDVSEYNTTMTIRNPTSTTFQADITGVNGGALVTTQRILMDAYTVSALPLWSGATNYNQDDMVYWVVNFPPADINTGTDTITVAAHGYQSGDYVQYESSATVAAGLVSKKHYIITNPTTNTFQLTDPATMVLVNITSQGTGVHSIAGFYIALLPSINQFPQVLSSVYWKEVNTGNYVSIVTTQSAHNLQNGNRIKVSYCNNTSYNGKFHTLTTQTSATKLTYTEYFNNITSAVGYDPGASGRVDQLPTIVGTEGIAKGLKVANGMLFYTPSSTQASLVAYVNDNMSDYLSATATSGSNPVSTYPQYYTGSGIVKIYPCYGSEDRIITLPSVPPFQRGAVITFTLGASANQLRTDIHGKALTVLAIEGNSIRVKVDRLARPSEVAVTITGNTWTVAQEIYGFGNAESFILTNDLSVIPASPGFTLKTNLDDLAGDDEAYLVSCNSDQLSRLIARLANSGLSNVSEVLTANMESEFQVKSLILGSSGGVQMAGGRANSHGAAVTGAGQIRNNMPGFDIGKDLRSGFTPKSFIRAYNTVAQNKQIEFNTATSVQIIQGSGDATLSILSGSSIPGRFQTERPITSDGTVDIKIEKHGNFVCYSQVGGTAMALTKSGLSAWSSVTTYNLGDQVSYNNRNYVSLISSNLNNQPDTTNSLVGSRWAIADVREGDFVRIVETGAASTQKFLSNNTGIFRVVRTYGDAFWIENSTAAEQFVEDMNTDSLAFYAPDSIMPGDKLVIATTALGTDNIGTFTVSAWDDTSSIPSPSTIKVNSPLETTKIVYGISSFSRTTNVVTVTTSTTHTFQVSDIVSIANSTSGSQNIDGTFTITGIGSNTFTFAQIGANYGSQVPTGASFATANVYVVLGTDYAKVSITEGTPLSLVKQIHSTGPSESGDSFAFLSVESEDLIDRVSSIYGGGLTSLGKVGMDESIKLGLDGYRYYNGLIAQLYKVLYGDPTDPSLPGVRAAGTDIDIRPPLVRRIRIPLDIRVRTGIPFSEIIESVKSAASGYINSLDVGESVSLSALTSSVQDISGIISVIVGTGTEPASDNGLIAVQPEEVAKVINVDTDVVVNILNN